MAARGAKLGEKRRQGIPNKRSVEIAERLAALGCDPIEGMARIAKEAEAEGDKALAGQMFKELAQYVAAKRKAVEMEVTGGLTLEAMLSRLNDGN